MFFHDQVDQMGIFALLQMFWLWKAERSLSFQKKATVSGSENDADADADGDANDGCDKSVNDTNDGQAEDFLTLDEVISI